MWISSITRFLVGIALTTILAGPAFAQYGGGGGSSTGGGYSSSTGIAIGAGAAAGVTATVLFLHYRGMVQGCVEPSSQGLRLIDEKNKKEYVLDAGGLTLTPGERVKLRGKKMKGNPGETVFQAKKLVKTLGACETKGAPLKPAAQ